MKYQITVVPKGEIPSLILLLGTVLETYAINCECPSHGPQPPIVSLIVDLPKTNNVGDWRVAIANILRMRFGTDCNVSIKGAEK